MNLKNIIVGIILIIVCGGISAKSMIFVVGPPGAGKTTLLKEMQEKHGWRYVSLGEILRNQVEEKTEIGIKIKKFMDKGDMVPLPYIKEIIINQINNSEPIVIMDGFPRTREYYDILSNISGDKYFVVVRAPINELRRRLQSRGRNDDKTAIIEKRLNEYQYGPLKQFEDELLSLDNSVEIKTDVSQEIYTNKFCNFVKKVIRSDQSGGVG